MARGRHQHGDGPHPAPEPEGTPPPAPEAAGPPPSPKTPRTPETPDRWKAAAVVASSVAVLALVALALVATAGRRQAGEAPVPDAVLATPRGADVSWPPPLPATTEAIERACPSLVADLDALPPAAPETGTGVAERIAAENAAVTAFLKRVNEAAVVGHVPDVGALKYTLLWENLLVARERYGFRAATGQAGSFAVPFDPGSEMPTTERIAELGRCDVPERLVRLPELAAR